MMVPGPSFTVAGIGNLLGRLKEEGQAKMLSISVKTVYSYAHRGLIPHVRIQSSVRFLKSEILNWVAERRFRPKPPPSQE